MEIAPRLPPDIVKQLNSVGMFRPPPPRSSRGLELEISAQLEVVRALARNEGSVGWNMIVNGDAHLIAQ